MTPSDEPREPAYAGRSGLGLALSVFLLWSFATHWLEGARHTLLRPDAVASRVAYVLVANYGVGILLAVAVIRFVRIRPAYSGFRTLPRGLVSFSAGSALGFAAYVSSDGATMHPVALTNLYAQVLGVSIAEVVVCWSLVGGSIAQRFTGRHRIVSLAASVVVSSALFGVYHFAHSPPFDTLEMVTKLSALGLVTSVFFLGIRDVYGTIAFHNWLGVIGVSRSLDAAGKLGLFEAPMPALHGLALLGVALLVLVHRMVLER